MDACQWLLRNGSATVRGNFVGATACPRPSAFALMLPRGRARTSRRPYEGRILRSHLDFGRGDRIEAKRFTTIHPALGNDFIHAPVTIGGKT